MFYVDLMCHIAVFSQLMMLRKISELHAYANVHANRYSLLTGTLSVFLCVTVSQI